MSNRLYGCLSNYNIKFIIKLNTKNIMEAKIDWETIKRSVFSIGVVLILILISIINTAASQQNINKTEVKNAVNMTTDLIQLIKYFKIKNIMYDKDCTYIVAEGEVEVVPPADANVFIVWCNRSDVYVVAKIKFKQ